MINETMYGLGNAPSAIRELFAYGLERKAQIGEDKVFDFSIGNPSVPAPDKVAKTMHELADMPPAQLHAYSPASGLDETKTAIADNLNRRFGTDYAAKNFYLTTGAAFLAASRQLSSIQVTRSSLSRLISPSIVSGLRLTAVLA